MQFFVSMILILQASACDRKPEPIIEPNFIEVLDISSPRFLRELEGVHTWNVEMWVESLQIHELPLKLVRDEFEKYQEFEKRRRINMRTTPYSTGYVAFVVPANFSYDADSEEADFFPEHQNYLRRTLSVDELAFDLEGNEGPEAYKTHLDRSQARMLREKEKGLRIATIVSYAGLLPPILSGDRADTSFDSYYAMKDDAESRAYFLKKSTLRFRLQVVSVRILVFSLDEGGAAHPLYRWDGKAIATPITTKGNEHRFRLPPGSPPELEEEMTQNEICKGGHGDDPQTWAACSKRDAIDVRLKNLGWCFGERGQSGFEMQWHRCTAVPKVESVSSTKSSFIGQQ